LKDLTRNKYLVVVADALRIVTLLCASGTLMQIFLKSLGFSNEMIYIHTTLLQAANILTIMLYPRWADKGSVIKKAAWISLPNGILFLCYLPVCIWRSNSFGAYVLLVIIGILQSVATGLRTVCEYKLPYYIYKRDEYGMITGICGAVGGVLSLALGALMSFLQTKCDYVNIMMIAFVIASFCMILTGVLTGMLRVISNCEEHMAREAEKVTFSQVFFHPLFKGLLIPNLLRGIAAGITSVLAIIALDLGVDETVAASMVSVQSVANLFGCLIFSYVSKYISPRICTFWGSLLFLAVPLLLITRSGIVFLILYAIIILGRTFVEYAVPATLLYTVPIEISGAYHAWRMILNNGGMLLGTLIATLVPTEVLLFFAAITQMFSGFTYLRFPPIKKATPFFVKRKLNEERGEERNEQDIFC